MLIRILTEDKNHLRVRELCAKRFDAFTILHGMGCWRGQLEPSLAIEIAVLNDDPVPYFIIKQLALDIKEFNDQDAVLIEYIESTNVLI